MAALIAALAAYAVTHDPPGVQGDEAFFLLAIRQPEATAFPVKTPLGAVSLMINAYVGTIKSGVIAVLFWLFGPSAAVARASGIACLSLSGLLFFLFARRLAPEAAAALCAAALLFDPAYVVTSVLDWGPVALQHVFLLLTLLAAAVALKRRSARWAFGAGLLAGLGIWDKVLFVFPLAGCALAALMVLRRALRWRLIVPAAAGAVLGAAPFLILLTRPHPGDTPSKLTRFDLPSLGVKAMQMRRTLDGTVLRDFVFHTGGEAASIAGGSRSLLAAACALALAALFPVRHCGYGRMAAAVLAGTFAAWVAMSIVRDVGLSAHHTILLWPAPYLFVLFVTLAWRERRPQLAPLLAAGLALLAVQNARVTFESRRLAMNYGFTANWTDAQYRLASRLEAQNGTVLLGDWGLADPLYLASNGKLALGMISDEYWKGAFDAQDLGKIAERLRGGDVSVVYRAGADQFFPHLRAAVEETARNLGLSAERAEVIADRMGRPRFEILTYRRP